MPDATAFDLLVRPLAFALLVGLVIAPLEHVAPAHRAARRSFATDMAFASAGQIATQLLLVLGLGSLLAALDLVALEQSPWAFVHAPWLRRALNLGSGLVLFELLGYLYHRLAHELPGLWSLHEVHHASETMDWLASFRQHPLEIALMTLVQNAPLVLLGMPLGAHATLVLLLKLNTVFVHANLRVPHGPWRFLLATPAFHHRHHAREGAAANFAALFPWIDRLFGTHAAPGADRFGLARSMPRTFVGLLVHPLREAWVGRALVRPFGNPFRVPNSSDSEGVAATRPGTPSATDKASAAEPGTEFGAVRDAHCQAATRSTSRAPRRSPTDRFRGARSPGS